MLVDGKWTKEFHPVQGVDKKGGFVRKPSSFRETIGSPKYKAEKHRYHLFVAYICPWACRTLALRSLKGLEDIISVSVVEPQLTVKGWKFGSYPGASGSDQILNATYMHEIYSKADPQYTGRATVPVLWDKQSQTIVNNESSEIIKNLNSGFNELLEEENNEKAKINLYPEHLKEEIDELNEWLYPRINNGVYKTGFATTQIAYEEACETLFQSLEKLEARLDTKSPYLFGNELTLSDIHLFMTLIRFDLAYYGLFKANLKHIWDYPNLLAYIKRLYDIPAIQKTVNIDHIKQGYYSIKALNPTGIVPKGPQNLFD
ncbi:MAG: glutathione S-transferase family protein [Rhodomicrobiaceae bacterium]